MIRLIIIIIMLLFSSIQFERNQNVIQSTHRNSYRLESPIYRYLDQKYHTTVYWPTSYWPLDVQNLAQASIR